MRKSTVLALVVFLLALAAEPLSYARADLPKAWLRADGSQANPLDRKERAQARFEAAHANVRELEQAKLEAARGEVEARLKEFLAGRGTLDILLGTSQDWLEAQRAVLREPANQLAALERHWMLAKQIDHVNQVRYLAGRIPIQDYLQSRHDRLEAQIQVTHARAQQGKSAAGVIALPGFGPRVNWLGSKVVAKAKYESARVEVRELERAKLAAARGEVEARFKEFLEGRGTLDILLAASQRWLDAERAVHPERADQVAALEKHWLLARRAEEVNRARHDAGRIPTKDYLQTKHVRLQTEIALQQAQIPGERPFTSTRGAIGGFSGLAPIDSKEVAQAKSKAATADLRELAQAKLQAILWAHESREKEFLAGRGTIDILLEVARQVRDSELAVAGTEADRRAALERYWVRTKRVEEVNKPRYEAGRISIEAYLQSRYYRLDAEIQLIKAQLGK